MKMAWRERLTLARALSLVLDSFGCDAGPNNGYLILTRSRAAEEAYFECANFAR